MVKFNIKGKNMGYWVNVVGRKINLLFYILKKERNFKLIKFEYEKFELNY